MHLWRRSGDLAQWCQSIKTKALHKIEVIIEVLNYLVTWWNLREANQLNASNVDNGGTHHIRHLIEKYSECRKYLHIIWYYIKLFGGVKKIKGCRGGTLD